MSNAGFLPRRWRTGRDDPHDADAIAAILDTPPLVPTRNGPTIAAPAGTRYLLPLLVAVKSLHRALGRGRVAICDDGTLTGADRTILAFHCGDPELVPAGTIRMGGFPRGHGWEPWLAAYDRRRGEYWLVLDPLAVARAAVPRTAGAVLANRSLVAGAALAGLAAGGPGRPDPAALFAALGEEAAPAAAARELLIARETGYENLGSSGEVEHFGPGGAAHHAAASRAALAVLR